MTTCILCNQDAELTCEACNERFCSEEHMKLHINVSTGECFPFKIKETEGVGRYKSFVRMKNGSTFFKFMILMSRFIAMKLLLKF